MMSKRVVISIIAVDHGEFNYKGDLTYCRQFVSEMPIETMRNLLDLDEGFSLNIVDGRNISFIDFHNYGIHSDEEVIHIIKSIPETSIIPLVDNTGRVVIKNIDANDDDIVPNKDKAFIVTEQKYEMGASDLSKSILIILNDPYANFAIGYILGKGLDWFFGLLRRLIPILSRNKRNEQELIFANIRRIYKNAAVAINSKIENLQIVNMSKVKHGMIQIIIRTFDNKIFEFNCNPSGKIIKFKMLHGHLWEIFCGEQETAE